MNDPLRRRLLGGVAAVTTVGASVGVNTDVASAVLSSEYVFVGYPYLSTLPECVRVATTMTAAGFFGPYTGTVWSDYSPTPGGAPCDNTALGRPAGWLEVVNYKGYNNSTICYVTAGQTFNPDGTNRATAVSQNLGSCPTTGNFSRAYGSYHNPVAGNPTTLASSWS